MPERSPFPAPNIPTRFRRESDSTKFPVAGMPRDSPASGTSAGGRSAETRSRRQPAARNTALWVLRPSLDDGSRRPAPPGRQGGLHDPVWQQDGHFEAYRSQEHAGEQLQTGRFVEHRPVRGVEPSATPDFRNASRGMLRTRPAASSQRPMARNRGVPIGPCASRTGYTVARAAGPDQVRMASANPEWILNHVFIRLGRLE